MKPKRPRGKVVLDSMLCLHWCLGQPIGEEDDTIMRRVFANGAVVPTVWRYAKLNG